MKLVFFLSVSLSLNFFHHHVVLFVMFGYCFLLPKQARTLEQEAHPALDKLTSKISTLNLERVRQIKSRLVAITGRVQKVEYFKILNYADFH